MRWAEVGLGEAGMMLFLSVLAWALPKPTFESGLTNWRTPISDGCASSGLRILTQQDARAPVVSIVTTIEAGAVDDPLGKEGLAHLAEHLWFRAHTIPDLSVAEALRRVGTYQGLTFGEVTIFVTETPRADLPTALAVEGQRFADPLRGVTPEILAAEREIVALELARDRGSPHVAARDALNHILFAPTSAYARIAGSTPASLAKVTLDDVKSFLQSHWRPERTTLQLLGDIDDSTGRAALWRAFPDVAIGVPTGTAPRKCADFQRPKLESELGSPPVERVEVTAATAHPALIYGWAIPVGEGPEIEAERPTLAILERVLQSDLEVTALATAPRCGIDAQKHFTVVTCAVELNDVARAEAVERSLRTRLRDPSSNRWDESFGRSWRDNALVELASTVASAESAAVPHWDPEMHSFRYTHHCGCSDYSGSRWSRIQGSTGEVSRARFEQWFSAHEPARVLVMPKQRGKPAIATAIRAVDIRVPDPGPTVEALRAQVALVATLDPQVSQLPNGLSVVVAPLGAVPYVGVDMIERGRRDREPMPDFSLVVNGLRMWFPKNIGFDLNEKVREALIRPEWVLTESSGGMSYTGPAATLADMFWLLHSRLDGEQLGEPLSGDTSELGIWLKKYVERVEGQTVRAAVTGLFPGNIWVPSLTPAAIRDVHLSEQASWKAWHRAIRQPENTTLVVVGGVAVADVLSLVETYFQRWPVPRAALPPYVKPVPEAARSNGEVARIIPVANLDLSYVAAACRLAGPSRDVSTAVAASLVHKRMFASVRERWSASYDPVVRTSTERATGTLLVATASLPASEVQSFVESFREATETSALSNSEVRRAAMVVANVELLARRNVGSYLVALRSLAENESPETWFSERNAKLPMLDAVALTTTMASCGQGISYAAAGPPISLRYAFEAVNLAPTEVIAP